MMSMQEWLEYVVKGLVSKPEAVKVTPVEQKGGRILYQVSVDPVDVGRVIGKKGATIHALRALLQVGCARQGIRATMDVVDYGKGAKSTDVPEQAAGTQAG